MKSIKWLLVCSLSFCIMLMSGTCKRGMGDAANCIDPSRINDSMMCTMQYDPVCGCDKKTYGNSCIADKAGVTSYTKGQCP